MRRNPTLTRADDPAGRDARHRRDIQGLRAVAVLLVVVCHAGNAAGVGALTGGYVGVDVFFVISGFLITGLLTREAQQRGTISLASFYARRARRILPAASLALVGTVAASFILLGAVRAAEVARESLLAALFALNWSYAANGTDYFATGLPPSPLQHFWSLAVEEQFYLVWPTLLFVVLFGLRRVADRRPPAYRWMLLGCVLAVVVVVSFGYSLLATAEAPASAYFSSLTRVWELGVGALLAIAASRLQRLPGAFKAVMGWLGLAVICGSAVLITAATPFPGWAAAIPVIGTALVLAGGLNAPDRGPVLLLGSGVLGWLGDRSYSLYLWHWPVLVIAASYLGTGLSGLQAAAAVAGALALTVATYRFVEHPIHIGGRYAGRRALLLWPTSIAVVCIAVLLAVYAVPSPWSGYAAPRGFASPAANPPATTTTSTDAAPTAATTTPPVPPPDPVVLAVAAAVDAASAGQPVPDTLTPPVSELRRDTWRLVTPQNCFALAGTTRTDVCSYGPADARRSMVIFGDSRAGMWLPAMQRIAETTGTKVYYFVKTACPVADVPAFQTADCADWRDWALGQIAQLQPDLVILSTREEEGTMENGSWGPGMLATVQALKSTTPRVVVFSETPELGTDPVGCLGRANATLAHCTFALTQFQQDINAADRAAAVAGGAGFLDLTPWLCWAQECPLVINGMIVSYGEGHLTRTYALALADSVGAALGLR